MVNSTNQSVGHGDCTCSIVNPSCQLIISNMSRRTCQQYIIYICFRCAKVTMFLSCKLLKQTAIAMKLIHGRPELALILHWPNVIRVMHWPRASHRPIGRRGHKESFKSLTACLIVCDCVLCYSDRQNIAYSGSVMHSCVRIC